MRQRAGEADELALADGERRAALADLRVDAVGQGFDPGAEADFAQRFLDARGSMPSVPRRTFDSSVPVKRNGSCSTMPKWRRSSMQVEFADIDAVEQNLPALNFVEAQQELDGRRLAGAGVADDGDRLSGIDAEADVAQDPVFVLGIRAAAIGEPDVAEFDFAARRPRAACGAAGASDGSGSSSS